MKRVLDASVILKWFLGDRPGEEHVSEAMDLFHKIQEGEDEVVVPLHWRAEVLSVLARIRPDQIDTMSDLTDLVALTVVDNWAIYRRAAKMSVALNHHLFDTLYHAVALENDAELITADKKYFNKARDLGAIALLG